MDPHKVLGVAPGATKAEIKKAFREKAFNLHPDRRVEGFRKMYYFNMK
jgi:curved DNA-binding protein CbpA